MRDPQNMTNAELTPYAIELLRRHLTVAKNSYPGRTTTQAQDVEGWAWGLWNRLRNEETEE
jgi:hypothetical protein